MAKYSDYVGFRSSSGDSRSIQTSGIDRLTITQSGEWDINGSGYGTSGQVLTSQGTGKTPAWLPVAGANYQEFSSSSTWNKPAGCQFVLVEAWGAGGGGGGGQLTASSNIAGTDVLAGGGGGGGAYVYSFFNAASLPSSVSVTIGAGGLGGSGSTAGTLTSGGFGGNDGGNTTFGTYLTAFGGNGAPFGTGTLTGMRGGAGGSTLGRTFSSPFAGEPAMGSVNNFYYPESFGGGAGGNMNSSSPQTARSSAFGGGGGGGYRYSNLGEAVTTLYLTGGASLYGGAGGNVGTAVISGVTSLSQAAPNSGFLGSGGSGGISYIVDIDRYARYAPYFANNTYLALIGGSSPLFRTINAYAISTNSGNTGSGFNYRPLYISRSFGQPRQFLYNGSSWLLFGSGISTQIPPLTSTDLTGWTGVSVTGAPVSGFTLYKVAFATGQYVAVGSDATGSSGLIYTSTDLSGWTLRSSGLFSGAFLWDVYHDGTRWITVGTSGVSARSTDGITWTTGTRVVVSGYNPTLYNVAGSGAVFVAQLDTAYNTVPLVRSVDTGNTWTGISGVPTGVRGCGANIFGIIGRGGIVYNPSVDTFVITTESGISFSYFQSGASWSNSLQVSMFNLGAGGGVALGSGNNYVATFTRPNNTHYFSSGGLSFTLSQAVTGFYGSGTNGGSGGIACGGGGGAAAMSGFGISGAGSGGRGGDGYLRVYTW